jgi:Zn finger protein HypA/HybF involved in hydrogenase expression
VCGTCGGTDVELVSGEEFLISSIDRAKEVC